jgi:hypothetical protein
MAGTLVITTLSDGTNSTSSTNCIQGSAKAWVSFDGTVATPSIRGSFNVSSVAKNSTGNYTVNFTTAMPNANYAVACSGSLNGANSGDYGCNVQKTFGTNTTTSVRIAALRANGSQLDDGAYIDATIFSV